MPTLTEEEPVDDKREESDSESEREIRERPSLRVSMRSRSVGEKLQHRRDANSQRVILTPGEEEGSREPRQTALQAGVRSQSGRQQRGAAEGGKEAEQQESGRFREGLRGRG